MVKRKSFLYIGNGWSLFLGVIPDNHEHAHHLIQITIGLTRNFKISYGKSTCKCRCAMVAPDAPHRVDDFHEWQALIHIDPETRVGMHIKNKFFPQKKVVIDEVKNLEQFIEELQTYTKKIHTCHEAGILLNNMLEALIGGATHHNAIDPRIQKALYVMKQIPIKKMTLKELAVTVCLSESRLTHLFKEQVGIPIRRYLLWLRLNDALYMISQGSLFTEAAHHAGFADQAHLSRTCRTMFGMRLNDFLKNSQSIQSVFCSAKKEGPL